MLDNDPIYKKLHLNYVNSFNPKVNKCPIHEEHTNRLRDYLDSIGYRMPKPKWKFDNDDITTWPYLPGYMIEKNGVKIKHIPSINHSFRFKHLL